MKPAPRLDIHEFNLRDPLKTTRLIGCVCKRREALSLAVLIGRELDHFKGLFNVLMLCSVLRVLEKNSTEKCTISSVGRAPDS